MCALSTNPGLGFLLVFLCDSAGSVGARRSAVTNFLAATARAKDGGVEPVLVLALLLR